MLAFAFATPLLLVAAAAGAIPVILHLIYNRRARSAPFPTLRFLHRSMERISIRRRLRYWVLMTLRITALVLLAVALAEPISRTANTLLGSDRCAVTVVLDDSLSMRTRRDTSTRFETARSQVAEMLTGNDRPAAAVVLRTCSRNQPQAITDTLDATRRELLNARCSAAGGHLNQTVRGALALLADSPLPQKTLVVVTDLQRSEIADLPSLPAWSAATDVQVLIVDAGHNGRNLAVTDLTAGGRPVAGSVVSVTATVCNFSQAQQVVSVAMASGGTELNDLPPPQQVRLAPAGDDASTATVRFERTYRHRGTIEGRIVLMSAVADAAQGAPIDDLPDDDMRAFSLTIAGRVQALTVSGPRGDAPSMAPTHMLNAALNPYGNDAGAWPVTVTSIAADQFTADRLAASRVVMFCNVPRIEAQVARQLAAFVRDGRTAVIFLGPDVEVASYNAAAAIMPGRLGPAVGQVGPVAEAISLASIDMAHPYFAWLGTEKPDFRKLLVQRYFRVKPTAGSRVLAVLEGGDPLLLERQIGRGRVVLCATTASPRWTDLPTRPLFLPMVERIAVLSASGTDRPLAVEPGSTVVVRVPRSQMRGTEKPVLQVSGPGEPATKTTTLPLRPDGRDMVAAVDDTATLGTYRWRVAARGLGDSAPSGSFSVAPPPSESDTSRVDADQLAEALRRRGVGGVYVGSSLAEARAGATDAAAGRNWWDIILAAAMLALLSEAVIANERFARERQTASPGP